MIKQILFASISSALLLSACGPAPAVDTNIAVEAMQVLSADTMQGRMAGSTGNLEARRYISAQATALNDGIVPDEHAFVRTVTRRNGDVFDAEGTNLIVTIPGEVANGPILEITAHFDHLGVREGQIFNGADDNASGTGALLSILKSFKMEPPQHEVRIIWLDAEEMGLSGARKYVEEKLDDRPRLNFNLDMIAQNQEGEIYMAGSYHTPALRPIIETAADTVDVTVKFGHDRPEDGPNDWTLQSDHGAFHEVGVPFVYFGVEDHEHYHRPTDTFETIPLPFYRKVVQLSVNTAHLLDDNLATLAKPAQIKDAEDDDQSSDMDTTTEP